MLVDSALLIPGRQTPVLFQPIDQPLYSLAETVEGTIKRTGAVFVLLPRDDDADPVASQVLSDRATPVGPALSTSSLLDELPDRCPMTVLLVAGSWRQFCCATA
jgi:hypothetical protein